MVNDESTSEANRSPWLATDSEVAQIASHLGLSLAPGDARAISGSFSRVFLLGDSVSERRVLKIRARWMTEGRIRFEHALARHLHECGLPMVAPLAIDGGSTWVKVGELYCEISRYIDGRETSPDPVDLRLLGALLGRFHRCSCDFPPDGYELPHFQNQAEPRDLIADIERLCCAPERRCEIETRWRELVDSYEEHRFSSLPQVIRHGDFHPWNVLFSRDEPRRVAALLDLDMSAAGPRAWDISYAISFLRRLFMGWKVDDWDSRYRQFVEGYIETCGMPLTEEETAAVPLLIECIAFAFLVRAKVDEAANEYLEYTGALDWLHCWGSGLTAVLKGNA